MAATRDDISSWFNQGVHKGATHMLVVCDNYDYEDYPVYVMPGEDVREAYDKFDGHNMQCVMEVYNLHIDKQSQMSEHRAFHF